MCAAGSLHTDASRLSVALASYGTRSIALASYGGRRGYVNTHEVKCMAARRSANYKPTIWSNDFIQTIQNPYSGEAYKERVTELKEDVRKMLKDAETEPLNQLELIDLLERLGVSYHFEDEIDFFLEKIANCHHSSAHNKDLYATSLEFRLLRQHGYKVSSGGWRGEKFKASPGDKDVKGLLHLYEASYLAVEGESILEEARRFSRRYLVKQKRDGSYLSLLVAHALELPLHWRMPRAEARWFIDAYQQCESLNPVLLNLAKLDYNIVQATHQQDLKHSSRWWRDTSLPKNSESLRDRLVENFLWTIGMLYEPRHGYFRRTLTKLDSLITTVDDIYDVYGTLDELQLFTDVITRWDINGADQLPDYMKKCFFAMHNSVNEMIAQIFKEKGVDILPFIKKAWTDLCEAFLIEAKWANGGYVPRMEEYIENAWVSISAPLMLCYSYTLTPETLDPETLDTFDQYSLLCRCSSLVMRLANDLGNSSAEVKRGDNLKSVECYMHEKGCGKDEAREHVQGLIEEAWKTVNKEILNLPSSMSNKTFRRVAMNIPRMAQLMYQHGDGHTSQDSISQNRFRSLLVNPIEVD